jgi:hypothetical protein
VLTKADEEDFYNLIVNKIRKQLTLFINENLSREIEKVRRRFNPAQFALIKSHITLCREDEIEQIEQVKMNLVNLNVDFITINFGDVIRFSDNKGVLIPAIGDNEQFQHLRKKILHGIIEKPRIHKPHITLMHPRNSACTDEIFKEIKLCNFPCKLKFDKISLIEQEPNAKWQTSEEFEM